MENLWYIYRSTGQATQTVATSDTLEYHGGWMEDEYITVTVKSPTPIDWHIGDYINYRGEQFDICYDPNVIKKAARGTYQEGFTYDNIKLYSQAAHMKEIGFRDVVLYDNNQTYTMLATFSFFCASVEDFADRLQANLNRSSGWIVLTPDYSRVAQRLETGTGQWSQYYNGDEDTGETDVNIDIDNQNCFDVCKYCYEKFGLAYYFRGKTIVIGGKPLVLNSNVFRYGKNKGLYEIERTADEGQELVSKLYAYGSTQNMPLNYYANLNNRYRAKVTAIKSTALQVYEIDIPFENTYFSSKSDSFNGYNVSVSADTWGEEVLSASITGKYLSKAVTTGRSFLTLDSSLGITTALTVGTYIYFESGIIKNAWPMDSGHIENVKDYPAMLSIGKLMLPGFPNKSLYEYVSESTTLSPLLDRYNFSKDKHNPWIESKNLSDIGLFEGTVNYDGSSQKEIFPTINNTSAGVVTTGSAITDNGFITEIKPFEIQVAADVLDWSEALGSAPDKEAVVISMTSGYCTGREFKVTKAKLNSSGTAWTLTLERCYDSSLNRYFPYYDNSVSNYCQIKAGDTFAVLGIEMPKEYIDAAAEKLLLAACGYLDRRDHMRYTYLPKIDEIYMARERDEAADGESYYEQLHAGMKLQFLDADLGINRYEDSDNNYTASYIDQLTIKENGNNGIPTFDVVMRDEKEKGTLESLTDSVSDLIANPPVQVLERQKKTLQHIEYAEWDEDGKYYHEDINTETNVLEQSYVWHNGMLWMCLETLTTDEPSLDSDDWKCVRGGVYRMEFYNTTTSAPYPSYISTRRTNISIPITPKVLFGDTVISNSTKWTFTWTWKRHLIDGTVDTGWSKSYNKKTGQITIVTSDMPTGWSILHPAKFECIASFNDGSDDVELSADVTI